MGLLRRIDDAGLGAPAPPAPVITPDPPSEAPAAPPNGNGSHGVAMFPSSAPPGVMGRSALNTNSSAVRTANLSRELKHRVKNRLIAELDPAMDLSKTVEVRQRIKALFDLVVEGENIMLTRVDRDRLFEEATADIIGF